MDRNTEQLVYDFQVKYGWTDEKMLAALISYLANQDSDDALADFLEENAELCQQKR